MVSAVSGTNIAASVLSSSTSSSTVSELKSQIAAKQSELAQTTEAKAQEELKSTIASLQADLETLENSAGKSSSSGESADRLSLSGESSRIGTKNFDADTPFGERESWI
ncbi:hypothetical protein FY152_08490 [Agrobacterium tumefaciens]|nr:hypothetical protein FY152_08490 [Agrobacterium tumefaciens]